MRRAGDSSGENDTHRKCYTNEMTSFTTKPIHNVRNNEAKLFWIKQIFRRYIILKHFLFHTHLV